MVGFGPEDDHFVAELTYNYGVGEYQLGNDFLVGESLSSNFTEESSVLCYVGYNSLVKRYCHVCFFTTGAHFAVKPSCE